jgi:hypothetical protein
MKGKTINAVIGKKFNDWLSTITDEAVKELVKKNTIITGGSIASMINNEEVKDFDVYFTNRETVLAVSTYYIKRFQEMKPNAPSITVYTTEDLNAPDDCFKVGDEIDKDLIDWRDALKLEPGRVFLYIRSRGVVAEEEGELADCEDITELSKEDEEKQNAPEKEKYRPVFFSSNAITLSNKIQIVIRFYGNAAEIHRNFDYLHATNYWTSEDGLHLDLKAFEAVHNKELIYSGSLYPVCSLLRMRKFLKRGFTIGAGEVLKMALNCNEFDLTVPNVLRDQLIGVDSAYFNMLINSIKGKDKVDRCYVTTIIDKMYN